MAVKRLIRPLVPDAIVARLRRSSGVDPARNNVDIVVSDEGERRRWLLATPATYRVVDPARYRDGPEEPVRVLSRRELSAIEHHRLQLPLADPVPAASVLAATVPPKVARKTTTEPDIDPLAIAVREAAWREVDGAPGGDLAGFIARLRAAGHRLAVVPTGEAPRSTARLDPIEGRGSVVILAPVPLHDVGGGFRGAQMAFELCRRGFHVAYVARYRSSHSVDLGLRFVHPRLEEYWFEQFDAARFAARVTDVIRLVLVQIPSKEVWVATEQLLSGGFHLIYDLIDDWSDPALGLGWWDAEGEQRFVDAAETLVGSAPALVERLDRLSGGRPATLIPNGVDPGLFTRQSNDPPDDLPDGEGPLFSYHGSLYGDWFDWAALRGVAAAYPEGRVMIIGDEHGHPNLPANVHFLGLKPQGDLPRYLGRADVSLIPFAVNPTTHAVSPLKAYESLAMGVPVAAPPLEPLVGVTGVHTDADLASAVAAALAAGPVDGAAAGRIHGWPARCELLLAAAGLDAAEPGGGRVRVFQRPAIRYPEDARAL